jgi:hypothetical protein
MKNLFCGIGESEILENSIKIADYPFEPSSVYPSEQIDASQIDEIHLNEYPPTIKIGKELIFISREYIENLKLFAERNKIKTTVRAANWNLITEPFLDTEFSEEQKQWTTERLRSNGISEQETFQLRDEIGRQMYKYNFDTMLWEWTNLGLTDVLSAMRVKLDKKEFKDFYWRAMEIEQRQKSPSGSYF